MYDFVTPRRSGIAVASTVALFMSGCDGLGPSVGDQSGGTDDLSEPRFSYREDGVVLSKNASLELADFVGAVQLDAVFPMSAAVRSLGPVRRKGMFKRVKAAQREVQSAMRAVEQAGENATPQQLRRLDRANTRIQNILKPLLRDGRTDRIAQRAKELVHKYAFLKGKSAEEIESILWNAYGKAAKSREGDLILAPHAVVEDTGQGDTCNVDCAVTAGFKFASVELAFAAATAGCIATTVGVLACMGWAFGAKYLAMGYLTWGVYTCTKKCE